MNWFFCCYDNFPVALHVSVTVLVTVTPGACPVTLANALLPLFEAFLLLNDQPEDGFTYISNVYLYKKYFVKNMKEAKMMFDQ